MNGNLITMPAATKRIALRLAGLLLLAFLTACATTAPQPGEDEVVTRAKARWAAYLDGDLEKAYAYLTPGYRSKMSYQDYAIAQRLRRVKLTSAEYAEHGCEGETCTLKFKVGYEARQAVPGVDVFNSFNWTEESWLRIDGEWWYLPKK